MIDFRYHLVSLIAVFLAVALGIVIGTTALNGGLLDNLQTQVSGLQEDKRALENETQGLQAQLDSTGGFAEAVGPALVDGTLTGSSVVLVIGSEDVDPSVVDEVTTLIDAAGATVTGTIRLTPEYSDPATAQSRQAYVTGPGGLPAGVTAPETDDAGELVAGLLAQVLMTAPSGETAEDGTPVPGTSPDTAATSQVLAGLSALGVLTLDSPTVTAADYAVVLTAGTVTADDAEVRTTALVALVTALDAQGAGAVVGGNPAAAGDGGLIGAIRADPENAAQVSTIDNVNAPEGRISTVLALSAESDGITGRYGTGEGAQPVPPVPAR